MNKKYFFVISTILSLLIISPVYAQSSQSIVLTADKTEGQAPLKVNFQADLKNFTHCGNTYTWDFGTGPSLAVADSCYYTGNPPQPTEPSRIITSSHTYDTPGTYIATLKVNSVVSNYLVITVTVSGSSNPPPSVLPPFYQFYRNLTLGSWGEDVAALQKFLNKEGIFVAVVGFGSPGNETRYFGRLTMMALARWQAAHGILPSVGYFGIKTRTAINAMMNR